MIDTRLRTGITAATCAMMLAASAGLANEREHSALQQLEKYCTASWRNARIAPQDWDECTQQAIVELLSRIPRQQLATAIEDADSPERRELSRSIWCTVQRSRRARRACSLDPSLLPDERQQHDETRRQLDDVRQSLSSPKVGLTQRQREIMKRWLDGYTVAEISQQLDLAAPRISDEKYKAVRKLREHFAA